MFKANPVPSVVKASLYESNESTQKLLKKKENFEKVKGTSVTISTSKAHATTCCGEKAI
eukprot:TRINITY_DN5158_c0_g1_i1.p2 TRINITY_DN5158_c0_g1~~TRINITY_DN5158_c0_g1_i1.p2  ORF type:complete len:59 (+),score=11.74 TRINITY_DN5158_c0_g1_i1:226-402(+)